MKLHASVLALLCASACTAENGPISLPFLDTATGPSSAAFSHSFDVVTGESLLPLLAYTHYSNKTTTQPITGDVWAVPDQIDLFWLDGFYNAFGVHVVESLQEYERWSYSYSSSSFIGIPLHIKADASIYFKTVFDGMVVSVTRWTAAVAKVSSVPVSLGRSWLQPGGRESQGALARRMAALPTSRDTDEEKAAYRYFSQTAGTAVAQSAVLGGTVQMMVGITAELAAKLQARLSVDIGLCFEIIGNMLSFLKGDVDLWAQMDVDFFEQATVALMVWGGDPTKLTADTLGEFGQSVRFYPAPLNVSIVELWRYADPVRAPLLQDEFYEYTAEYNGSFPANRQCNSAAGVNFTLPQLKAAYMRRVAREQGQEQASNQSGAASPGTPSAPEYPVATLYESPAPLPVLADNRSVLGVPFDIVSGAAPALRNTSMVASNYSQGKVYRDVANKAFFSYPNEVTFASTPCACMLFTQELELNATAVVQGQLDLHAGLELFPFLSGDPGLIASLMIKAQAEAGASLDGFAKAGISLYAELGLGQLSFGGVSAPQDPAFEAAVAALPPVGPVSNGSALPGAYSEFVGEWGTHFVSSQKFGGYCEFEVVVNASVRASMEVELMVKASMTLLQLYLESKGLKQKMSIFFQDLVKLSAEFKNGSMVVAKCGGGYPGDIEAGAWEQWVRSIPFHPAPIPSSFRLQPVSQLVDDLDKRYAVQLAVADYIKSHAKPAALATDAEGWAASVFEGEVVGGPFARGRGAEFVDTWSLAGGA